MQDQRILEVLIEIRDELRALNRALAPRHEPSPISVSNVEQGAGEAAILAAQLRTADAIIGLQRTTLEIQQELLTRLS